MLKRPNITYRNWQERKRQEIDQFFIAFPMVLFLLKKNYMLSCARITWFFDEEAKNQIWISLFFPSKKGSFNERSLIDAGWMAYWNPQQWKFHLTPWIIVIWAQRSDQNRNYSEFLKSFRITKNGKHFLIRKFL